MRTAVVDEIRKHVKKSKWWRGYPSVDLRHEIDGQVILALSGEKTRKVYYVIISNEELAGEPTPHEIENVAVFKLENLFTYARDEGEPVP